MELTIDKLIEMNENEWLEFKCCWYEEKEEDVQDKKRWGEFLKDFSALFNTNSKKENKKYLIIGFDEDTGCQDYDLDKSNTRINVFKDKVQFKKLIIKKLKNHFKNIPIYKESSELPIISELFDIEVKIVNAKKLLIFTIKKSPYLLEIKKQLSGNETFREGSIIIRHLKVDGSPEVKNAGFDEKKILISEVEKNKINIFPENERSIKKIVEVFKNKELPASTTSERVSTEYSYSSGSYFEIFKLRAKHINNIDFLYYPKYTSLTKIYNIIDKNKYLEFKGKKIILIDEKNQKGGIPNKQLIKDKFEHKFHEFEVFTLEEYPKKELYPDLNDLDFFHQGNFGINDFIKPYTDISDTKTADLLLSEWYESSNEPLLVIKGIGGIGKTTAIKYFLDDLYDKKHKKVNILFINFKERINDIMKNPILEDIFDFYKIVAKKNNLENILDKKSLELCLDDGNLILVLDGLDEVIAKTSNKFNINKFLESIYTDYSGNFEKTKILITCRDYFWDKNTQKFNIQTMQLKPFTEDMTKAYFKKHFNTTREKEQAMKYAKVFSIQSEELDYITFVPYILDMIRENLIGSNSSSQEIKSDILINSKENINDFLIGKSCEREIIKLSNSSIDTQINIFIGMVLYYQSTLQDSQLKEFLKTIIKKSTDTTENNFKEHPLLKYNSSSKTLTFRYDFFTEYFENIHLSIFLKRYDFEKIDDKVIRIMIEYISYDDTFMDNLIKRLSDIDFVKLKGEIFIFLAIGIYHVITIDNEERKRLSSALFILLLRLQPMKNIKDRTALLKEIYDQENENIIKNLSIINLHINPNRHKPLSKVLFDFSELKFEKCHFENYDYFSECKFNENTFFSDETIFISPLNREGVNSSMSLNNVNSSHCNVEGIIGFLEAKENKLEDNIINLRKDLKQIIKFFWSHSTFRQKTEEEVNKKLRDYANIIKVLKKEKILKSISVSTKQKRNDTAYNFSEKYLNLRKIMEENETCNEFEEILKIVQEKM